MLRNLALTLAGAMLCSSAWAFGPGFHVDGYYANVSADTDTEYVCIALADYECANGFSDDGDGYGIRGTFKSGVGWLLAAEYESIAMDSDVDHTDSRVGVGYEINVTPLASLFGRVDYIRFDDDVDDEAGVGAYVGGDVGLFKQLGAYARVGYMELDDISGVDGTVGLALAAYPLLKIFAEYRMQSLNRDGEYGTDLDLDLDSVRVGMRVSFNN